MVRTERSEEGRKTYVEAKGSASLEPLACKDLTASSTDQRLVLTRTYRGIKAGQSEQSPHH